MKILHVIPFISKIHGGPSRAILEMCRSQNRRGVVSEILTTTNASEPDYGHLGGSSVIVGEVKTYFFKGMGGKYRYSRPLALWLKKNIAQYDLIHIHSIFNYPTLAASYYSRKNGIPYIIRAQGILYDWCLENISRYKKLVYLSLFEMKNLRDATAIHFTTEHEKFGCHFKELQKRSYVLPLGIEPSPQMPLSNGLEEMFPLLKEKKILLFLARIHRIKGLDILLPALSEVLKKKKDWMLVLAGGGEASYVQVIKNKVKEMGLEENVFMPGHVDGLRKQCLLHFSHVFVQPSHSENFGISIIEAMEAGLPVAISDQIAVKDDVLKYRAGLVFSLKPDEIRSTVERLMGDEELRNELRMGGRRLVEEKYRWDKIAEAQISLYKGFIASRRRFF